MQKRRPLWVLVQSVSHSLIWQTCNCFMKTGVYVYSLKDNSGLQRKKYLKIVPICFSSSFFFFLLVWYKFAWYSIFLKKAIDIIKKIDTILDFVGIRRHHWSEVVSCCHRQLTVSCLFQHLCLLNVFWVIPLKTIIVASGPQTKHTHSSTSSWRGHSQYMLTVRILSPPLAGIHTAEQRF